MISREVLKWWCLWIECGGSNGMEGWKGGRVEGWTYLVYENLEGFFCSFLLLSNDEG